MDRMTISIDSATKKAVEAAAAREAVSISSWVRECLLKAAKRNKEKSSLDVFYGCISDDSFHAPEELPGGM